MWNEWCESVTVRPFFFLQLIGSTEIQESSFVGATFSENGNVVLFIVSQVVYCLCFVFIFFCSWSKHTQVWTNRFIIIIILMCTSDGKWQTQELQAFGNPVKAVCQVRNWNIYIYLCKWVSVFVFYHLFLCAVIAVFFLYKLYCVVCMSHGCFF